MVLTSIGTPLSIPFMGDSDVFPNNGNSLLQNLIGNTTFRSGSWYFSDNTGSQERTVQKGKRTVYDGTDDKCTLGSSITIPVLGSVKFWGNFNSIGSSAYFLGGSNSAHGVRYDGTTFLVYNGTSVDTVAWTKSASDVEVTVVRNTTTEYEFFINGATIGTSDTGDASDIPLNTFGSRSNTTLPFTGALYDFRFYDENGDITNHYKTTESTNLIAYDSVGGNHGTYSGITASSFFVDAADGTGADYLNQEGYNQCIKTEGDDGFVTYGNSVYDFEYNEPFSITGTFFGANEDVANSPFIVSRRIVSSNFTGYNVNFVPTGKIRFYLRSTLALTLGVETDTTYLDNEVHSFAVVYQGDSDATTVKIFIDGEEVALTVLNDTLGSNTTVNASAEFIIGHQGYSGNYGSTTGQLYQKRIKVFDSALSDADAALESNGSDATSANPVFYVNPGVFDSVDNIVDPAVTGTYSGNTTGILYLPRDDTDKTKDVLGNTLDYSGLVKCSPRIKAACGDFDGTDDDCFIAYRNSSLHFNDGASDTAFSVFAEFNMDDATAFTILTNGATNTQEFRAGTSATDLMAFTLWTNTSANRLQIETSAVTSQEGSWQTYVFVYGGGETSDDMSIYRKLSDGSFDLVPTVTNNAGTYTGMNDNQEGCNIGRFLTDSAYYANGKIGRVCVVPVELTTSQMQEVDQGTYTGSYSANWSFGVGGSNTVLDGSGNNNHGALTGITAANFFTTDYVYPFNQLKGFSGGVFTDGTNDFIDMGTDTIGTLVNGASQATYFWRGFIGSNQSGSIPGVFGTQISGNLNGFNLRIDDNGDGTFDFRAGGRSQGADSFQSHVTGAYDYDSIHSVMAVYDYASDTITVYIDGALEGSTAVTFGSTTYVQGSASSADALGRVGTTSLQESITAEFQMFNVGLDADDASALHNDTYSGTAPVLNYQFTDISGSTVTDSAAGGNDGTLSGAVWARIPRDLSTTGMSVTGRDLTNPSGSFFNNSEATFEQPQAPALINADELFTTDFFFDSGSGYAANDIAYSDLVANYGSDDILFVDVSNDPSYKINMLFYDEVQTGAALEKIEYLTNQ